MFIYRSFGISHQLVNYRLQSKDNAASPATANCDRRAG